MKHSVNSLKIIKNTRELFLNKTILWNNREYIGYSHLYTIRDSFKKEDISVKESLLLLKKDVTLIEKQLNKHIPVNLNQNQFDALISLVYDIGIKRFITDEMFVLICNNKYIEASLCFNKFNKYMKKPVYRLIKTRKEENKLWMKPIKD